MFKFIVARLISGLAVVVSVIVLITSIVYLAPVDPARLTFGQQSDAKTVAAKRSALGLDKSLPAQVSSYLGDISPISFDQFPPRFKIPNLRQSYQTGRPVAALLAEAIPRTALLALAAFALAAIIGVILGIIASLLHGTWWDDAILFITTLGISLPSYVSAIVLALVFGYLLAPITGLSVQGSIVELNDLGDEVVRWRNLILPAIALGIRPVAIITQLMRSTMLDVLHADYIKTARAKGLPPSRITRKHALPNALNPVVTALTGWFAALLAGAFFVERVFNFKGIGDLTITALVNYDIPVLLACILFISIVFVVVNVLADLLYTIIDPQAQIS